MISRAPLVLLLISSLACAAGAASVPVAKLTEVKGAVEYAGPGSGWHSVADTKYLFEGQRVRTAAASSAKLIEAPSGAARIIGANSVVAIRDGEIVLESGELEVSERAQLGAWQALVAQLQEARRYTATRRKPRKDEPVMVATSESITLSPTYPELVWENVGPGYGYRLVVDDEAYRVPIASTAEMIRYALPDLEPGSHEFMVQVTLDDDVVYTPRSRSVLTWLSAEENRQYLGAEKKLRDDSGDDALAVACFMSAHGLLVPAMDALRDYFRRNPEDNDMRPLLIKAYNDLELLELREAEAIAYNAFLSSRKESSVAP